ncbi:ABC transporter ATP-binding protein [Pseudohaliea rubra]|uniref:AttE component of AttEFGH ABC transport system n=1 Tax=Pseudohaliea rubra DSM 19751 TaxID=1265313 RepID=A0A095WYZ5_9GAMM|nr:ABC transporter ATP-binding protein [Pseudohaliea rubra]KGE03864.1 AttE component of AttEFGH ABC transport system [Pseudohaliea rubra DSM 19751]
MLTATGITYQFREGGTDHKLLTGIDLSLAAGECVALLGASGSGKSTLLNLLGTIDSPQSGSLLIGGREISALAEPERTLFRRRHIGFVYQRFLLVPTLTVAENIRLPLDLLGVPPTEAGERVAHWLEAVGLARRGDSFPDRLSGGEQQRVAIARALIHEPDLVLADEPTGSLDPETGERVLALLLERARQGRGALLLVTHSEAVAARADRVLRLEHGRLVAEGGPGE